jgi:small-conductance mechanosensitive channel
MCPSGQENRGGWYNRRPFYCMANSYSKWMEFTLADGFRLAGILLVTLVLNRLLKLVTSRLVKRDSTQTRAAQMREQQTRKLSLFLYWTGSVVLLFAAILTALPIFGVNAIPVAAMAGVATVALGFGAQHLVWDLINGFFIIFEDQFVVGDIIRVGAWTGRVEHLTLRRTVLREVQGGLLTLSNGVIREVANLSRDWSQVWVDVVVANDAAVDKALALLEKISSDLRGDAVWSAALVDGPRVLGIESLSLSGTTLRVQVRTAPSRQDDAARELRRRIKSRFEAEQISLAIVQRVELVGGTAAPQQES